MFSPGVEGNGLICGHSRGLISQTLSHREAVCLVFTVPDAPGVASGLWDFENSLKKEEENHVSRFTGQVWVLFACSKVGQ